MLYGRLDLGLKTEVRVSLIEPTEVATPSFPLFIKLEQEREAEYLRKRK